MRDPTRVTRADVRRLGVTNPGVHVAMDLYEQGRISWEEAVNTLVVYLADQVERQQKALVEAAKYRPVVIE